MANTHNLIVQKIDEGEVYKDLVRVPERHRGQIGEGRICKLSVNGHSVLRSLRGLGQEQAPVIQMDEVTRRCLKVKLERRHEFSIREVGWLGQFLWAWNASDPAPRLSARIGIVGGVLTIIGLCLTVATLW